MLNAGNPSYSRNAAPFPLVGREREADFLGATFQQALQGYGRLVLVSGEAGIGKSALVEAFTDEAAQCDPVILRGYCYDLTTTPPYGLWLELTDRYKPREGMPALPEVLKRGTGVGALQNQLALFEVAREFLHALAREHPLIIVLKDVHWSDQASLDLLRYLARYLDGHRILLIVTYRDGEVTRNHPLFTLLPLLVRESNPERVDLRRLASDDVRVLLDHRYDLSASDAERMLNYLQTHAEGNPLYLGELLRTLEDERVLRPNDDGWALGDLGRVPVPQLVQQLIEQRLTRVGDPTRELLQVAAIIGQDVPLDTWQAVSGASETLLSLTVEQATAAYFLEESSSGDGWRFSHALVREALYEGVALVPRRRWHRLIGETLARMPDSDPDAVAHHFQMAKDLRAVEWLVRATNRAELAYAFGTAAERLERAIQVLEGYVDRQRQRGWLLYRLGMMNRWINPEKGAACLEDAMDIADQIGDRLLGAISRSFHGILLCLSGQVRQGLAGMEAAVIAYDELAPHERRQPTWSDEGSAYGPAPELAWPAINPVKGTYILWLGIVGRYEEAVKLGEQFVAEVLATDLGEQLSRGRVSGTGGVGASENVAIHGAQLGCAYAGKALALAMRGLPSQAATAFANARETFASINHHVMVSNSAADELLNVVLPYHADDCARRERLATDGETAWTKAQGAMRGDLSSRVVRLPILVIEGQWTEACELARGFMQSYGNVAMHMKARVAIGSIARYQGDTAAAWKQVHDALPEGPESEPGDHLFSGAVTLQRLAAELALDAGETATSRRWLEAHDRWLAWGGAVLGRAEGTLHWAQFYLAEGDEEAALDTAYRALHQATDPDQPMALIAIRRFLGELATRTGDLDAAEHHLDLSRQLAEACAIPNELALTLLAQAELAASNDEPRDVRTLLTEVRRISTDLGAQPTLARAEHLIARLQPRQAEPRFGLSPREQEVLSLLVQGQSDKEIADELFISHHTVMRHVSNVLRKLDVDSRTAAALTAIRDGLV